MLFIVRLLLNFGFGFLLSIIAFLIGAKGIARLFDRDDRDAIEGAVFLFWVVLLGGEIILAFMATTTSFYVLLIIHLYLYLAIYTFYAILALYVVIDRVSEKMALSLVLLFIIAFIVSTPLYSRYLDYNFAQYGMNKYTNYSIANSLSFIPEGNPEIIRVNTASIAHSIALSKVTEAAGVVTPTHLGLYNGTVYWITGVTGVPLFGFIMDENSNFIRKLILTPTDDATGEKTIILDVHFNFGEGLGWERDIFYHVSEQRIHALERCYYVYHNGTWYAVVLAHKINAFWFDTDPRIFLVDTNTGDLVAEYTPETAPEWLPQIWPEEYVTDLLNAIGAFRWDEKNNLNFWRGVGYESDRAARTGEELRYQILPNGTVAGFMYFSNDLNTRYLELIGIVTRRIYLYDVHNLQLISPQEAKFIAKTGLPSLSEGNYTTPLALLYRIGDDVYWHVPIYVQVSEKLYPVYFVLVNARTREVIRTDASQGFDFAVREAYAMAQGRQVYEKKQFIWVNGTVESIVQYIENGNTRIVLSINNGTNIVDILVRVEDFDWQTIAKVLHLKPGDEIRVKCTINYVAVEIIIP